MTNKKNTETPEDVAVFSVLKEMKKAVKPPPKLTVSEWAERYRVLSTSNSAESGRWNNDRAVYQKGIMDSIFEKNVETIVFMASAQVGKTEILNNIIGYLISQSPSPILVVQPTVELGKSWSKERFDPMLRDTKILQEKISPSKSRSGNNTILFKKFDGGFMSIAGSNAPSQLASRPIRAVLCDEIDRYPASAGEEGDPVNLAIKRTTTFSNRKIFLISTPTIKGSSRIERAYELSDQRYFKVPCPDCGHFQSLKWGAISFQRDEKKELIRGSVHYNCEECGVAIEEKHKPEMIFKGKWEATASPASPKTIGFHLNELYSPFVTWTEVVQKFLEAKKDIQLLKTWKNTSLGETWEEMGERLKWEELYNRRVKYETPVPEGVFCLTAGVDTQDDRLEVEVVGWGYEYESWGIDYAVFHGDPAHKEVWLELDEYLKKSWKGKHATFVVSRAFIDSGGHKTQAVYDYCYSRKNRGVFAIKGQGGDIAVIRKQNTLQPTKNGKKVTLYNLGVDTAKSMIYSFCEQVNHGAGYMHFPHEYDQEYFKMLTAEQLVTEFVKGYPKKKRGNPSGRATKR